MGEGVPAESVERAARVVREIVTELPDSELEILRRVASSSSSSSRGGGDSGSGRGRGRGRGRGTCGGSVPAEGSAGTEALGPKSSQPGRARSSTVWSGSGHQIRMMHMRVAGTSRRSVTRSTLAVSPMLRFVGRRAAGAAPRVGAVQRQPASTVGNSRRLVRIAAKLLRR